MFTLHSVRSVCHKAACYGTQHGWSMLVEIGLYKSNCINITMPSQHYHYQCVWWRPQKTVRHAKTALLFHRAQSAKYALHCVQYAKCTGLNRRWNNWKTQQNLLFVNVFIWRIKFPCKSMAFSNFSYNTLFNATSVKLRLRALSMQKGMCGFWVG